MMGFALLYDRFTTVSIYRGRCSTKGAWRTSNGAVQVIILDASQYLHPPERLLSPERVLWTGLTAMVTLAIPHAPDSLDTSPRTA